MPDDSMLEQRLMALEKEVADLRRRLGREKPSPSWLDKVVGSIAVEDAEAFQEVLAYGRAFREADRPSDDADPLP